jgi:hypothetical protein
MSRFYCYYRYHMLMALILFLIFIISGCQVSSKVYPQALNGTIDLTHWNFTSDGSVELSGEWEFYWEQLLEPSDFERAENTKNTKTQSIANNQHIITIPSSWNDYKIDGQPIGGEGFATFRLNILMPEHEYPKAINLSSIYTAHKLWVNGQLVSALGEIAVQEGESIPKHYPKIIPLTLLDDTVELVLQVSNFSHRRGGIWQPITIGNTEDILEAREHQLVLDMILMGSLFGSLSPCFIYIT